MKQRWVAVIIAMCVVAGATVPAGASAARPPRHLQEIPAALAPGCTVDLASPVDAELSSCSGFGRTAPEESPRSQQAPLPCLEIAVLDDRCEAWSATFDGGEGDFGGGLGASTVVATSPTGDAVYSAGTTDTDPGSARSQGLVIEGRSGDTGDQLWVHTLAPEEGFNLAAVAVVADLTGAQVFAMARAITQEGCARQTLVMAFDAATGEQRWETRRDAPAGTCGSGQAVQVDPEGSTLYLVGGVTDAAGRSRLELTALDAATGSESWDDSFVGATSGGAVGSAVAVSADGATIFAAGAGMEIVGGGRKGVMWPLLAYDRTGQRKWVSQWAAPKPEQSTPANTPAAVAVSPDGSRVFMVGGAAGVTLHDIFTVAFDSSQGAQLWESGYEGIRNTIKSSFDSVWYHGPLGVSPDGNTVFVAGYSTSLHGANLGMDFLTLALDAADGTQIWNQRHTSDEWIHWLPAIAVHPDGNEVYVAGQGRHFQLISAAFETFAYNAVTGEQNWAARYNDGLAYWNGMAMSPDGSRVFSTGSHVPVGADPNRSDDYDLATVGYATD